MRTYADSSWLRRAVRQATTSRPLARASGVLLPSVDRLALRATRGRTTFSQWVSGLPVVGLTTTGRRSGERRTTPVLGIPDGDALVVVGANFGRTGHPAWVLNLRADPTATTTVDGRTTARTAVEQHGAERERLFAVAVSLNPGWLRYRSWAGAREIPVFRLERAEEAGRATPGPAHEGGRNDA